MIPFSNETVTLIRRTESTVDGKTQIAYETVTLTGCSWHRSVSLTRTGEAFERVETISCRSPADQTKPQAGDLMILGDVDVTVTSGIQYNALIESYADSDGAFVVRRVKDNARTGFPMPHYRSEG